MNRMAQRTKPQRLFPYLSGHFSVPLPKSHTMSNHAQAATDRCDLFSRRKTRRNDANQAGKVQAVRGNDKNAIALVKCVRRTNGKAPKAWSKEIASMTGRRPPNGTRQRTRPQNLHASRILETSKRSYIKPYKSSFAMAP